MFSRPSPPFFRITCVVFRKQVDACPPVCLPACLDAARASPASTVVNAKRKTPFASGSMLLALVIPTSSGGNHVLRGKGEKGQNPPRDEMRCVCNRLVRGERWEPRGLRRCGAGRFSRILSHPRRNVCMYYYWYSRALDTAMQYVHTMSTQTLSTDKSPARPLTMYLLLEF